MPSLENSLIDIPQGLPDVAGIHRDVPTRVGGVRYRELRIQNETAIKARFDNFLRSRPSSIFF